MSINTMRSTSCLPNLQTLLVIQFILLCLASCNTAFRCPECDGEEIRREDNVTGKCDCWQCPICREGTGSSVKCGTTVSFDTPITCVPCAPHLTFSNTTGTKQCQPCTACQNHELVKQEYKCTPEKDTECGDCAPGFYRNKTTNECLPCSLCCAGDKESIKKCKEDGGESASNVCQFDGRCMSSFPILAPSTRLPTASVSYTSATPSFVGYMMSSTLQLQALATPLTSNIAVIVTESPARDGLTVQIKPSSAKDTRTASSMFSSVVPSIEQKEGFPKDEGTGGWTVFLFVCLVVLGIGGFFCFIIHQCRLVLKKPENAIEAGLLLPSGTIKPEESSSSVISEDGTSCEIDEKTQSARYSRQHGKQNEKLERNDDAVEEQQPLGAPLGSDVVVPLSLDGEVNKLQTKDPTHLVEEGGYNNTISLGNTSFASPPQGKGVLDLPYSTLQKLYKYLNEERYFCDDYRGVAERIGLTARDISSLEKNNNNPAKSVISYFISRKDGTVDTLMAILQEMDRFDILRDVFGTESHV